ncbi:titin homolog isoform X2 [Acipenser ruthenus]|nr:titin homolog isoform X2 [Acipenser ruthenus]XP_058877128.1 titin homolog isoform X2 [Acipenser ruthenus]
MEKNKNKYRELDQAPGERMWVEIIERDIDRQFPFHEMFLSRDGHGQRGLLRVLKAYTQYRPEEGYCQGQGPVAAVLLMNMPAEQAFWCLVQISEKYVPGYYSPLLEGVHFDAQVFAALLKRHCPHAHRHLRKHGVEPLMYCTEWFMCLFTRALPFPALLRVWDMFFSEGVKVLFRVALVLVRSALGSSDRTRECDGQLETLERLRSINERSLQEEAFIQEVCSVSLSEREVERETSVQFLKWQQQRPDSTFDPRGRCQGSRAAHEANEREERERELLAKRGSTLSLSFSLSLSLPLSLGTEPRRRKSVGCAREQDRAGRLGEGTGEELGSCTGDSEGTGDRDRGSDLKEISRKEGSGFEGRDRTSEDQAKDSKAVILNVIDQEKETRGEDINIIDQEKETRGEDINVIDQEKETRGEDINVIDQEKETRGEDINIIDQEKETRGEDINVIDQEKETRGEDINIIDQEKETRGEDINVIDQEKETRGEDINIIDQEKETRGEDINVIDQEKETRGEDINAIDQEKDPRGEDLNTVDQTRAPKAIDRVGDWKAAEERVIDPNTDLIVPDPSGIDQAKDSRAEALTAIDWEKDTTGRVINTADGNPKAIDQAKDSKAEVINTADGNPKAIDQAKDSKAEVINTADGNPKAIDQAKDSKAEVINTADGNPKAIDQAKDSKAEVINTADGNPKAIDQAKDSKAEVINTADQEKYFQGTKDDLNNKTVQVSRAEELGVINAADRKRGSRTGGNAINTDPVTAAADQDADSGLDSAIDWGSDQTATGLGDVEPQKGQIDAIDQDKDAVDDNVDQEIDPVESPERSAQGSAGKEIIDPSRGGVREIDQVSAGIDTDDQEGDSAGKAKEFDLLAPELDGIDPIGKGAKATADLEKEPTAAHQKVIDPGINAIDQERNPSKAGRNTADQGAISKDPGGIDRDQVQIDPQQPAIDRSDVPMTEKQTAIGLNRDFKARQRNQFKKPTDKECEVRKAGDGKAGRFHKNVPDPGGEFPSGVCRDPRELDPAPAGIPSKSKTEPITGKNLSQFPASIPKILVEDLSSPPLESEKEKKKRLKAERKREKEEAKRRERERKERERRERERQREVERELRERRKERERAREREERKEGGRNRKPPQTRGKTFHVTPAQRDAELVPPSESSKTDLDLETKRHSAPFYDTYF